MSEPQAIATEVDEVVTGVWHWSVDDDRIRSVTHSHAVTTDGGIVLIDPLPLDRAALEALGEAKAVCLTAACHQRSSWRLRRELGVPVHAPEGARTLEEEPNEVYGDDALLPGGLRAVYTPGPEDWHYCFLLEREPSVLFCSDLLVSRRGDLDFVPLRYHDDPEKTRASVRRLLQLDFEVLCLDHGMPITHDPHLAIRELLARA